MFLLAITPFCYHCHYYHTRTHTYVHTSIHADRQRQRQRHRHRHRHRYRYRYRHRHGHRHRHRYRQTYICMYVCMYVCMYTHMRTYTCRSTKLRSACPHANAVIHVYVSPSPFLLCILRHLCRDFSYLGTSKRVIRLFPNSCSNTQDRNLTSSALHRIPGFISPTSCKEFFRSWTKTTTATCARLQLSLGIGCGGLSVGV